MTDETNTEKKPRAKRKPKPGLRARRVVRRVLRAARKEKLPRGRAAPTKPKRKYTKRNVVKQRKPRLGRSLADVHAMTADHGKAIAALNKAVFG